MRKKPSETISPQELLEMREDFTHACEMYKRTGEMLQMIAKQHVEFGKQMEILCQRLDPLWHGLPEPSQAGDPKPN